MACNIAKLNMEVRMGWGGKAVGAGLGALFGGPLGAAIGGGIGAMWDAVDDEPDRPVELDQISYDSVVMEQGPGVRFAVTFVGDEPLAWGYTLVVRFKKNGEYIRSAQEAFADSDGDLFTACQTELEASRRSGMGVCAVPIAAFGKWTRELEVEAWLVDEDGEVVAQGSTEFDWPKRTELEDASLLAALVCACIGVVRADGELERSEVKHLRQFLEGEFELDEFGRSELRKLLKRENSRPSDARSAAARIAPHMTDGLAEPLLHALYAMADADGRLSDLEEAWIAAYCLELGIPLSARAAARQEHVEELHHHYELLELSEGASAAEIKRAYRRLARDYHPDKVANLPKGFQEFATTRMRELNEAYTVLLSHATA